MAKNEKNNGKNAYEQRRKWMISIVCIILAALFLLWTVAGTMLFTFGEETAAVDETSGSLQTERTPSRMRGIWVATAANLDYPTRPSASPEALKAEADIVIRDCYDMGMNAIFLQVRPAADAFYPSAYFPWSRYLTGTQGQAPDDDFDPLAYWVEKAHERGIELHAWINPFRITSSSSDWNRLSWNNPAKGAWNDYVIRFNGNYYFDPGQPAVRDLITAGAAEIVENYDVDGIHFDDYFYPELNSGASFNDAASYAAYGSGMSLADWRRDNINQLIRQVNDAVHAADPHCVFGVSPMGVWANSWTSSLGSATRGGESYSSRFADSYTWVKNHWLDYIAPQIYWNIGFDAADYQILANWWSQVVQGTGVELYIGMADYKAVDRSWGWSGPSEIARQLNLNASLPDVSGEIHFRYKSAAGNAEMFDLYKELYAANRVPALTDPAGAEASAGLYDISGHWAESVIVSLVQKGVITGMGDGTFRPESSVTRAQFVKMLALVSGFTDFESLPDTAFEDLNPLAWYIGPIKWAASKGIVSGRSLTEFAPDERITRQEMAVMLHNYCTAYLAPVPGKTESEKTDILPASVKKTEEEMNTVPVSDESSSGEAEAMPVPGETDSGVTDLSPVSGEQGVEPAEALKFQDQSDVAAWAAEAVQAVTDLAIMNGVQEESGVYFCPSRNTTRAEAAKVIFELSALSGRDGNSEEATQA